MKSRIKQIRAESGLTQAEFGSLFGVSRDAIATYESGRVLPSRVFLECVCARFDINLEWLESGSGEMKKEKNEDEKIAVFIGKVLSDTNNTFVKRIILALSKLNEEELKVFERFVDSLSEKNK